MPNADFCNHPEIIDAMLPWSDKLPESCRLIQLCFEALTAIVESIHKCVHHFCNACLMIKCGKEVLDNVEMDCCFKHHILISGCK